MKKTLILTSFTAFMIAAIGSGTAQAAPMVEYDDYPTKQLCMSEGRKGHDNKKWGGFECREDNSRMFTYVLWVDRG
jgi:hypothetical protein